MEFKHKDDSKGDKARLDSKDESKGLPDPRGIFRKLYDSLWAGPQQMLFYRMRDTAIYRFNHFFGLQKKEKSFFEKMNPFAKRESDSPFNFFGQTAKFDSWNPLTRSKSAAKRFLLQLLAVIVVFKVSVATFKTILAAPFSRK